MIHCTRRSGFTLVETILFVGILAIVMGAAMTVSVSTEESRIRQRSIAEVEQYGAQILSTVTGRVRRSESVLAPSTGHTGGILHLQMSLNEEHPTIVAATLTGGLIFVQKNILTSILPASLSIDRLTFRNIAGTSVTVSFDLTAEIPLVKPVTYTRHFEAAATLFVDDAKDAGGCTTCPTSVCTTHSYHWYTCESEACTLSESTLSC